MSAFGGEELLQIPLLSGGISQQPANVRFPSQVQDASNVDFTVLSGASKRPPTKYVKKITGLTLGNDTRLHAIERDASERYLVIYGDGALRVFTELGVQPPDLLEATVTHSSDATAYLTNGAVGEHIRLTTIEPYTIVVNTTVEPELDTSPTFTITSTFTTYEEMVSHRPTNQTYHRTTADSAIGRAGFWYYDSGTQTFAKVRFPVPSSSWLNPGDSWNDAAKNPMGFRIGFQRLAMSASSCTTTLFSGSQYTLTKTGLFSSYTPAAGDMIYVVSGTGVTAGWATVDSKVDSDNIRITARGSCVLGAAVNVVVNGIGTEYDVSADFDYDAGLTPASLIAAASKLQEGLVAAGCADGLISWNRVSSSGDGGYFEIVSPWKGTDSEVRSVTAPPTGYYSLVSLSHPFYTTGASYTAGTGGNPTTTQDPSTRWTKKPASNQIEARPKPSTMPMQLVREIAAVYPDRNIASISAANPAVVTITNGHDLATDQKVIIAGTSGTGSGPTNAEHTVTVLTDTTFSIPIDLSGGAPTGGTYYARALFTVDTIDWEYRYNGTEDTNAAPQPLRDGTPIRDVAFVQDRLLMAMGQYLVFSQAGGHFNLFATTASNPVDSDPIVEPLGGQETVNVDFLSQYRDSILVWTFAGQHYIITWDQEITATKLKSNPAIKAQCWSTRPVTMDSRTYFISERGSYGQINEYYYDDILAQNVSVDITIHCPTFVPLSIREMCCVRTEGAVLCLPDDTSHDHQLFVYRAHWNGNIRDQSAWTVYTFDTSYRISGFAPIRNAVYLLVESASQWIIDVLPYEVTSDSF